MPSVEIELINELRKRVEELEKAVLNPIHYIEPDRPSPLGEVFRGVEEEIYKATGLPKHMMTATEARNLKPPLGRAPAYAYVQAEGEIWRPITELEQFKVPLIFGVKFMDGWIWDCIAGWRHE